MTGTTAQDEGGCANGQGWEPVMQDTLESIGCASESLVRDGKRCVQAVNVEGALLPEPLQGAERSHS